MGHWSSTEFFRWIVVSPPGGCYTFDHGYRWAIKVKDENWCCEKFPRSSNTLIKDTKSWKLCPLKKQKNYKRRNSAAMFSINRFAKSKLKRCQIVLTRKTCTAAVTQILNETTNIGCGNPTCCLGQPWVWISLSIITKSKFSHFCLSRFPCMGSELRRNFQIGFYTYQTEQLENQHTIEEPSYCFFLP